jgi:hypothetical protein
MPHAPPLSYGCMYTYVRARTHTQISNACYARSVVPWLQRTHTCPTCRRSLEVGPARAADHASSNAPSTGNMDPLATLDSLLEVSLALSSASARLRYNSELPPSLTLRFNSGRDSGRMSAYSSRNMPSSLGDLGTSNTVLYTRDGTRVRPGTGIYPRRHLAASALLNLERDGGRDRDIQRSQGDGRTQGGRLSRWGRALAQRAARVRGLFRTRSARAASPSAAD